MTEYNYCGEECANGVGPKMWVTILTAALLCLIALPLAGLLKPDVKCD